ncbi:MAG: hypothetical protein V1656_02165 [Candidatus Jorgensenbacteria bacterium]
MEVVRAAVVPPTPTVSTAEAAAPVDPPREAMALREPAVET